MGTSRTSAALAAFASFFLPGAGQLYAGRPGRAAAVFLAGYSVQMFGHALGLYGSWALIAAAHGAAAWDAWRVGAEAAAAQAAAPPAETAPAWLRGAWAAVRLPWILLIPGALAILYVSMGIGVMRGGRAAEVAAHLLLGGLFFVITVFALRHTGLVASGRREASAGALKSEIGGSLLVYAVLAILFAMVYPSFSGLYRKSHEGAMKGRLAALRLAFSDYASAHEGRAPASLDELVAEKRIEVVPELWPGVSKYPHDKRAGFVLLADRAGTDSGLWALAPGTSVFIDCTHTDTRGSVWTAY